MSEMPDESDVVILRFPAERCERPSIEAVTRLAPPRSWVKSLVEDAGIAVHDVAPGMAREFAHQLRTALVQIQLEPMPAYDNVGLTARPAPHPRPRAYFHL